MINSCGQKLMRPVSNLVGLVTSRYVSDNGKSGNILVQTGYDIDFISCDPQLLMYLYLGTRILSCSSFVQGDATPILYKILQYEIQHIYIIGNCNAIPSNVGYTCYRSGSKHFEEAIEIFVVFVKQIERGLEKPQRALKCRVKYWHKRIKLPLT